MFPTLMMKAMILSMVFVFAISIIMILMVMFDDMDKW